jgi:MATE family multidrug resistance protein
MLVHTSFVYEIREAIFFPNEDSFKDWGQYLAISLPGIMILLTLSFSMELAMVMAGMIDTQSLAEYTQIAIVYTMMYFANGFLDALIGLMGNLMGEQKPDLAKRVLKVLVFAYLCIFLATGTTLYLYRHSIARLFSPDPVLQQSLIDTMYLISIYTTLYGMVDFMMGPLFAFKMQATCMIVFILCNVVIGIPTQAILALKLEFGVQGLISGSIITISIVFTTLSLVLYHVDFHEKSKQAKERIDQANQLLSARNSHVQASDDIEKPKKHAELADLSAN